MKKISFLLLAISIVFNVRADITTGLVGYWTLSDGPGSSTVIDHTTNGNNGTLTNFADTTYSNMWTSASDPTNGWPYALQFNQTGEGTNTYVSVPNSTSLNLPTSTKQFTLAAWVKCSVAGGSEPANAGIIAKGNQGQEAYALYMSGGKFTTALRNAGNTGGTTAASTTTPAAGQWYHVVAVVSEPKPSTNSEIRIYVNGVQESAANGNTFTTLYGTNLPVTIGCRFTSSGVPSDAFQGAIDEVRIYDRVLADSEIQQLYQNRAFSIANTGIGFWNGLAGSGGNATLDSTSLNFCTNVFTAPLGTPGNLNEVLGLESTNGLQLECIFGDTYDSSGSTIVVNATNLTIAPGGVAIGSSFGAGSLSFINSLVTYALSSSDGIGIKDGANPTSLSESGTSTVVLTGTNSFSGGVTINSGTLQVGNGGAVSGQELGTASSLTDAGSLVFDGTNNAAFSTSIFGTGTVTQKGTGTLTLSTANSYSGGTTIVNGAINAAGLSDFGSSALGSGAITLKNGTLLYTGTGDSTLRQVNGTAATTNTIDVPSGVTLDFSGRVTASAAWVINKVDGGTLSFSGTGDNSFLGVNVNAGTLILNKGTGTGHAIGNPLNVAAGATVQMSGGFTAEITNSAVAPVTISSGGVFDANGQNEIFNKLNLSGSGIGGTGALINSAASTTSTLSTIINLATNTTVGGAGSITLQNATVTGSGSLTYSGSGILSLQGTNTYTGGTFVTSGTLDGNIADSIPGDVTVSGTGVLQLDNSAAMFPIARLTLPSSPPANSVNLNFFGTQNIGVLIIGSTVMPAGTYGASATNPNNAFTGSGLLNVVEPYWDANGSDATSGTNVNGGGSGSWDSTTSDWWVGGNVDTTWMTNNTAFFAGTAGTVTLNANESSSGLYFLTPGYVITNRDGVSALSLVGNNPIVSIPAGTTAIGCNITGGGTAIGLTANGPGTLILTGTNSYSGGTLISSNASVIVNNISDIGASAIGNSGNLVLANGALTLTGPALGSTARVVSAPAGTTNTIDVASGTSLELDGSVSGSTTSVINKTDAGTLILGGTTDNSSLNMNIEAGEVIITKTSASNVHGLGGGPSSIASGAELQLSGSGNFDLFDTCTLTIAGGGVLDLNSQSEDMSTLTMSGVGAGNGVLINSTTNATSMLTNGGSGVVLAGATTIGGPGSITMVSTISGTGSITYAGSGNLTMGGNNTYSGGVVINPGGTVTLTNSVNSGGSGTITDNSILNVAITNSNLGLKNTITGPGTVNIIETVADNLELGGNMSSFTGTINCPPGPGSNAKAQILTTNVALSSAATINIAAGGTLYIAEPGVVIPGQMNIFGLGNNEAYGALRIESNAVVSGPVTLYGNTTMGNGHAGAALVGTISGPIGQTNGAFGITFTAEPGTIVLTGTNTYTGPTTISMTGSGQVFISGSGTLGAGNYPGNVTNNAALNYASSASQMLSGVVSGTGTLIQSGPGLLTLAQTNTFTGNILITNGSTLAVGGTGSLGAAGTSNNYAGSISNYGTLNYASSAPQTLAGVVFGTGALTETGPGKLTLSAINGYTGATTVASGATLALASSGSINNTASLSLAAGGTFDVSAFGLSYSLGAGTTLQPAGTGTGVGSTAATITGSPGGTINVGPLVLTFTPLSVNGDTNHPALYVSAGALNLSGSGLTVSNAASPLGAGTYSLVQVASQNLNVAGTNVTVTGAGLAAGATASLALSGGSLNLVVAITSVSTPVINQVSFSGGNLVFSGTNGPAGRNYVVLGTTNITTPLNLWTPVVTNSFSGTGTFSVTTSANLNQQFFRLEVQ